MPGLDVNAKGLQGCDHIVANQRTAIGGQVKVTCLIVGRPGDRRTALVRAKEEELELWPHAVFQSHRPGLVHGPGQDRAWRTDE